MKPTKVRMLRTIVDSQSTLLSNAIWYNLYPSRTVRSRLVSLKSHCFQISSSFERSSSVSASCLTHLINPTEYIFQTRKSTNDENCFNIFWLKQHYYRSCTRKHPYNFAESIQQDCIGVNWLALSLTILCSFCVNPDFEVATAILINDFVHQNQNDISISFLEEVISTHETWNQKVVFMFWQRRYGSTYSVFGPSHVTFRFITW